MYESDMVLPYLMVTDSYFQYNDDGIAIMKTNRKSSSMKHNFDRYICL